MPSRTDGGRTGRRAVAPTQCGGGLGRESTGPETHGATRDGVRGGTDWGRRCVSDSHDVFSGADGGSDAWTAVRRITPTPQWGQRWTSACGAATAIDGAWVDGAGGVGVASATRPPSR